MTGLENVSRGCGMRCAMSVLAAFVFMFEALPLFSAERAVSEPPKQTKESMAIALSTTAILTRQHYVKHKNIKARSQELFDAYLQALDPQRMFFTKQQVEKWQPQAKKLIGKLMRGDASFAYEVFAEYLAVLREYEAFVRSQNISEADLEGNGEYELDRANAPRPENAEDMKKLWRSKLCNDLILLTLADRIDEPDAKTAETDKKWKKVKPSERLVKRAGLLVDTMSKYDSLEVLEIYINSFAKIFDPHTQYMAPRAEEDFNIGMSLSLVGIGAVLMMSEEGYTKIVSLMPGGPAEQDGRLKPGDRIIAVAQDGQPPVDVVDMPLAKVVSMIRGELGTKVILTVLDGAKGPASAPVKVDIIRRKVVLTESEAKGEIRTVAGEDGGKLRIGVISLPSFYFDYAEASNGGRNAKSSARDVEKLIEGFKKSGGIDALVMDLRSNGGGSLRESVLLTGLFIKRGPVVQIRDVNGNISVEDDNDGGKIVYDGPMCVMTNKLSASASEIFAGAIKDYSRGVIIGDASTHGKGTVQIVTELDDYLKYMGYDFASGMLKLTTSKFYRVNGESTQLKGVVPDIAFPSFSDVMDEGEEKLDNPMPWDAVASASGYSIFDTGLPYMLPILRKRSEQRVASSPEFGVLKKDIAHYKERRARKNVSLNFTKRWKDYLEEKKIYDEQSKLLKLDEGSSADRKKNKAKDIYMDEALCIMRDLVHLKKQKQEK